MGQLLVMGTLAYYPEQKKIGPLPCTKDGLAMDEKPNQAR